MSVIIALAAVLAGQAGQVPSSDPPAPLAAAAVTEAPVDPARLAVARIVIDLLLPPSSREQMIDSMTASQSAIMRQGFTTNPQFTKAFGDDPRVRRAFNDFLLRMSERSRAETRALLPEYSEALARAYARRFDLKQLDDIRAFFDTPTGHAYSQISIAAMSDPDVVAWQRNVMARSMSHFPQDIADFARQAAALQSEGCAHVKPCREVK